MDNNIKNYIKNNLLFDEVDIDQLDFSSVEGELIFNKSGEYIIKNETLAEKLFLIIEGTVITTQEEKKQVLKENYFFGKEAAKGDPLYNFIAVADEQTLLLALSSDEAAFLIEQNPKLSKNLDKDFNEVIPADNKGENNTKETSSAVVNDVLSDFPEQEDKQKIIETKFDGEKTAEIIASVFESPAHFSAELLNDIINESEDENFTEKLSAVKERIELLKTAVENASIYFKLPNEYQTEKYELGKLLNDLSENIEDKIGCEIVIENETTVIVEFDYNGFITALEHVLINACESMNEPETITITINKDENLAEILIRDSGKGIPLEFTSDIFEPYFSYGKENHIGLGLAIADKIISGNKGKIAVKNTGTEGTVMSIILPIVE